MPLYLPPEWSPEWSQDILGPDFHTATMPLGDDPDGETDIYATVVRYSPTDAHRLHNRPAMLFVHGMSDYFSIVMWPNSFTNVAGPSTP